MEMRQTLDNRQHVCFVALNIWPVLADDRKVEMVGGAEVQQTFIIRGLRNAGFRVTVVTEARDRPDEFELDGLRIVNVIRRGREFPVIRNVHPRLTSLWNAAARANADVYCQQCASVNTFLVGLFAKYNNRRFIYMGASDPDFQRDQLWKKFPGRAGWRAKHLYQWGLKLTDGIVAQHQGQVEDCQRWFGKDAIEIPNGYAAPPGSQARRDGVILWAATVKSLKRPELFLELARRLPHLRFCMVGGMVPGAEAAVFPRIKDAARHLPNLEFVGYVPFAQVESYFDKARVFINTSEFEGFPNTFLQSWARGIPTISFIDCRAREDGRPIGFVSSDIEDMATTLTQLETDDDLWERESMRAKRYFEANHSVPYVVNKYTQLFDRVLPHRRAT